MDGDHNESEYVAITWIRIDIFATVIEQGTIDFDGRFGSVCIFWV